MCFFAAESYGKDPLKLKVCNFMQMRTKFTCCWDRNFGADLQWMNICGGDYPRCTFWDPSFPCPWPPELQIQINTKWCLAQHHVNRGRKCRYIKMDDASPLPPTVQKWSQNIPDTRAAIFRTGVCTVVICDGTCGMASRSRPFLTANCNRPEHYRQ